MHSSMNPRTSLLLASTLAIASLLAGCGSGNSSAADETSALSAAIESSVAASGTLLCTPAEPQLAACAGKAAGDACALTPPGGAPDVAGTCRATIDGAAVACAPTPPGPPQELVDACAGKAAGVACQVSEAFGNSRDGVCVTARNGATLVCGRDRTPPQGAIDACAALAAGAACTLPGHMGAWNAGGRLQPGLGEHRAARVRSAEGPPPARRAGLHRPRGGRGLHARPPPRGGVGHLRRPGDGRRRGVRGGLRRPSRPVHL